MINVGRILGRPRFIRPGPRQIPASAFVGFLTNFSGANESPISEGGSWLNGALDGLDWLNFQVNSNIACAAGFSSLAPPPYNDSAAILKSTVFAATANQYARGVVHKAAGYNPANSHELGLFVRANLTGHNFTAYEAYVNHAGNHTVVRWDGALNAFTPLASNNIATVQVPQDGDIYLLTVIGTQISFYQNGILCTQVTDTSFASGQPGMQSYMSSGGTATSYGFSQFSAGNL